MQNFNHYFLFVVNASSQVALGNAPSQAVALPVECECSEPQFECEEHGRWHDAKCNFAGNCVPKCLGTGKNPKQPGFSYSFSSRDGGTG